MNIDLSLLYSKNIDKIDISGKYSMPKDYYNNSDIINLKEIIVDGYITQDEDENDVIKCTINSEMTLLDSITLEEVNYPFSINYDDIITSSSKKNKNTLDIFRFLWENIVLEVPLRFTKVEDLSKFHGDGWKLISEDELNKENNPFSDLFEIMNKE
jgi:uncharacterized protein